MGVPDATGRRPVSVHGRPATGSGETRDNSPDGEAIWASHATGYLVPEPSRIAAPDATTVWPPEGATALDVTDLYERLVEQGYGYGPVFQGLRAAWQRGDEVFAEVALPEGAREEAARFGLHPALLDAALHAAGLGPFDTHSETAGTNESADAVGVRLPFSWSGVSLRAVGAAALRARGLTGR